MQFIKINFNQLIISIIILIFLTIIYLIIFWPLIYYFLFLTFQSLIPVINFLIIIIFILHD